MSSRRSFNESTTEPQRRNSVGLFASFWRVICRRPLYPIALHVDQRFFFFKKKKDMQISVKETTIFSVFHPDAQDLFNTCSDLKKVAWELWDPSFRLNSEVNVWSFFLHSSLPSFMTQKKKTIREKQFSSSMFSLPCYVSDRQGN